MTPTNTVQQQQGIVAIVAVMFTSILISVITIALIGLMTNQIHESNDASDRVAAQYAAESGAQDALAYITDFLSAGTANPGALNQFCSDPDKVATIVGISTGITCRQIEANGNVTNGFLPKDTSVQFDLTNTTKLDLGSLEIDWDAGRRGSDVRAAGRTFANNDFNNPVSWQGPPALEITVATNASGATNSQSIYLLPQCYAFSGSTSVDLTRAGACNSKPVGLGQPSVPNAYFGYVWSQNNSATATSQNCTTYGTIPVNCKDPATVDCFGTTGADYDCKTYLPGFLGAGPLSADALPQVSGASQYIVRIKALNADADYQLTLRDCGNPAGVGTCNVVPIALPSAQIDVTAQAGSAYQRISEQVPVRSNPLSATNYALLGIDQVCKDLSVYDEGSGNFTPVQNSCFFTNSGF